MFVWGVCVGGGVERAAAAAAGGRRERHGARSIPLDAIGAQQYKEASAACAPAQPSARPWRVAVNVKRSIADDPALLHSARSTSRRGALRATNALSLSPGIATARASARSAGAAQRREVAIGCVVCCKKNARRARVQH